MSEKVKGNTYEIAEPKQLCFKRTDLFDEVTKIWAKLVYAAIGVVAGVDPAAVVAVLAAKWRTVVARGLP